MQDMPENGEAVTDEGELRSLCERLHLSGELPEHEPDRYARAADLYERVMARPKPSGLIGIYDQADLERAKRNVERVGWAREMLDEIVRDADYWVGYADEALYAMVPAENPMALTVAQYDGCPIHGGNRSTFVGDMLHPYQWRCELGGEWWYQGIEVTNPGTGEQIRVLDEGPGWVAPEGFPNAGVTYYFTGAYRALMLYRLFSSPYCPQSGEGHQGRSATQALALGYALTGNSTYAHKAGILLNRLAEVYGRLQGIKEGFEGYDKSKDPIRGYVGEASGREQGFLNNVLLSVDLVYDALKDDEELVAFYRERGGCDYDGDGKASGEDILYNLNRNLFAYAYEFLDRTLPLAGGDFLTSSLYSLVHLGACLGNGEMIHQALNCPTGIYNVRSNSFFRDGKFWYDSSGYCMSHGPSAISIAEWTLGSTDPDLFPEPMDLYRDPKLRIADMLRLGEKVQCDGQLPQIGDTGGGRTRRVAWPYTFSDEMGYVRLDEDREYYAQRILRGTGGNPDSGRVGGDLQLLFHAEPWEGPTEVDEEVELSSEMLHDSGFCILRAGKNQELRRHVVVNFGKGNRGHGHSDKLAVNIISSGYDLSADLGYPPSWVAPKIEGFEKHTASHFTAMIDGQNQVLSTGSLNTYAEGPWVRLADASGERAYPGLATTYRRCVALVPIDDSLSYVVDLFRLAGGTAHDYSFHSLSGEDGERFDLSMSEGASLVAQEGGTLAGPDVAFAETGGYGWIQEVASVSTGSDLSATWMTEEGGPGIRLHLMGEAGSTVYTGKGEGTGLQGHSPWDRYLLSRRNRADGDESRFFAVLEPISSEPYLRRVDQIRAEGQCAGVRVDVGDAVHYAIYGGPEGGFKGEMDGYRVSLSGAWAFVEVRSGRVTRVQTVDATALTFGGLVIKATEAPSGGVDTVDVEGRAIVVTSSVPLPTGDVLKGETILISNPGYICNTSYPIASVQEEGENRYRIELDEMALLLSEGSVREVDDSTGVLHTDTPMLKLEVVANLFDGKVVSGREGETGPRLRTAEKGKLTLEVPGEAAGFEGGAFYIYDIGPGDTWRIGTSVYAEEKDGTYGVRSRLPAEVAVVED